MFRTQQRMVFLFALGVGFFVSPSIAKEAEQSDREAMYYRFLELPSLVKGLAVRSEQAAPTGIRQHDRITVSTRRSK